jgi:hypothetical protein
MIEKLPVLAGSVAVILLMVGVAWALGFRPKAKLDDAALARLAGAEGASIDSALYAPDGKAALARLTSGKIMVARAMGGDISARTAAASAVRVRLSGDKLSLQFADVGYPPLHMRVQEPPHWLAELAGEAR